VYIARALSGSSGSVPVKPPEGLWFRRNRGVGLVGRAESRSPSSFAPHTALRAGGGRTRSRSGKSVGGWGDRVLLRPGGEGGKRRHRQSTQNAGTHTHVPTPFLSRPSTGYFVYLVLEPVGKEGNAPSDMDDLSLAREGHLRRSGPCLPSRLALDRAGGKERAADGLMSS
jgi:hypothetical protein